jgi:hypothetical protein
VKIRGNEVFFKLILYTVLVLAALLTGSHAIAETHLICLNFVKKWLSYCYLFSFNNTNVSS